ncbi:hypothetical protein GOODEAATRI_009915, partial [Goodea atripinnis]
GVKIPKSYGVFMVSSFNYERQQALVQEQLAKLAQRERETAAVKDMDRTTPAVIMEKWRTHEEQEKAKLLIHSALLDLSLSLKMKLQFLHSNNGAKGAGGTP